MEKQTPLCRNCRHYYITHDPGKNHGCRAMKFKSQDNPARVVFASSGIPCQLFQEKKKSISES